MKKVTVRRDELLAVLEQNREQHRAVFEEAIEGYRQDVIDRLEQHIDELKNNKVVRVNVTMPFPEDHTEDYNRVIKMVEMSVADEIELEAHEFAEYVMDDWSWKRNFVASTMNYIEG